MHDAEHLVFQIYEMLFNDKAPARNETLLVIMYDEGGGLPDPVPPPLAIADDSPWQACGTNFVFSNERQQRVQRLGVRVPAILVSPRIRREPTVLRPQPNEWPFDHTSLGSSLRTRFSPDDDALSRREAVAPTFWRVLEPHAPPAELEAQRYNAIVAVGNALPNETNLPGDVAPSDCAMGLYGCQFFVAVSADNRQAGCKQTGGARDARKIVWRNMCDDHV